MRNQSSGRRVVFALVAAVLMVAIIRFTFRHWAYIEYGAIAVGLALVGAIAALRLCRLRTWWMVCLIFMFVFGVRAYKSAYFVTHMPTVEEEFRSTAAGGGAVEHHTLNYGGALDEVLAKRDALLRDCGFRMNAGPWWTSTDAPTEVPSEYVWTEWTVGKLVLLVVCLPLLLWYAEERRWIPQQLLL